MGHGGSSALVAGTLLARAGRRWRCVNDNARQTQSERMYMSVKP